MRARNIKPGFFLNCELSDVDFASRLLFIGLWCYADREGRFEWKPKQIKATIFPYDEVNIEKLLCNLMSLHFITRNDTTGYVEHFKKHQNPHPHEAKSILPKYEQNQCHDMPCKDIECNADVRIEDVRIPDIKPTTATTRTEEIFIDCFSQNVSRLKELYPHANYEAERETCIAHYRAGNPPVDCWPVVLKWFQRVPKPKAVIKETPKTFEQIKMDNTKQAMQEFLGEAEHDGFGQKTICIDDGRSVSGLPVRHQ